MIIHHYHRETGEFYRATEARPNPEEPGKFLIPACVTEIAPPETLTEGHVHVFTAGEWSEVEDHRGTVVYDTETKQPSIIEALGPLPEGVTKAKPEAFQKWDAGTVAWVADERAVLLYDIAVLEMQQTSRRLREAALGNAESVAFLQDLKDQIAVKRAALTALDGGAE